MKFGSQEFGHGVYEGNWRVNHAKRKGLCQTIDIELGRAHSEGIRWPRRRPRDGIRYALQIVGDGVQVLFGSAERQKAHIDRCRHLDVKGWPIAAAVNDHPSVKAVTAHAKDVRQLLRLPAVE